MPNGIVGQSCVPVYSKPSSQVHIVQAEDIAGLSAVHSKLVSIAKRYLGTDTNLYDRVDELLGANWKDLPPYKWQHVAGAGRTMCLPDTSRIVVGTRLALPEAWFESQVWPGPDSGDDAGGWPDTGSSEPVTIPKPDGRESVVIPYPDGESVEIPIRPNNRVRLPTRPNNRVRLPTRPESSPEGEVEPDQDDGVSTGAVILGLGAAAAIVWALWPKK